MRGGRMLVIVGLLVLVGAAIIGGVIFLRSRLVEESEPVPEGTAVYVIPEEEKIEIVVAAQEVIPQGARISEDAVKLVEWSKENAPEGHVTSIDRVRGRIALEDIPMDTPITENMLTERLPSLRGSEAALLIPEGKVAYALPVARYSSVAWAIQPGDHVDVLISMLLLDIDEEFQTILPNQAACVEPPEGEGCESGTIGRLEVLANGWVVNVTPSEVQRPRLVTQMTVQNAVVLHVGDWAIKEEGAAAEEPAAEEGGVVEPERSRVEPLTLIVTPQDAMVLKYAEEVGASIDFVLRSSKDHEGSIDTEMVTLQYVFDRFTIELPPKLPYGTTPPVRSLRHHSEYGRLGTGSERLPEEIIVSVEE